VAAGGDDFVVIIMDEELIPEFGGNYRESTFANNELHFRNISVIEAWLNYYQIN